MGLYSLKKDISFSPVKNFEGEQGITAYNIDGIVVNLPKPIEYCVKFNSRVGYWKIKKLK